MGLFASMLKSDVLQSRAFGHAVRWSIVLALWTLLISMAIGKFGISNYLALKENAEILKENNLKLALKNQELTRQIESLKKSAAARKLFLASELGSVQNGEILLHLGPIKTYPEKVLSTMSDPKKETEPFQLEASRPKLKL